MRLTVHPHAKDDLKRLLQNDVNGVGKLLALLQEIQTSPTLIDLLNVRDCTFKVGKNGTANACGFASLRPRRDLWRLKTWDSDNELIPYRIIYGFFPVQPGRPIPKILILAVVFRDEYDYEHDHAITLRVLRDYDDECN